MRRSPILILLLTAACAHQRPVLYPDERLKTVGEPTAQRDVDECLATAKVYLKANPATRVARRVGWAGAVGAAMGAVTGLIFGDLGRAAAGGAAVGAVGGAAQGAWEAGSPDEIARAYTQRCLAKKGYSVIGWK